MTNLQKYAQLHKILGEAFVYRRAVGKLEFDMQCCAPKDGMEPAGADHFVYGSDFGQIHNPRHIIGNRWMIQILLAYGVSKEDIAKIFKTNPAKHLGLE